MNSKTALIMDLDHDIKCALGATHLISPGPLACAYFNQSRQSFLHCDGCRADGMHYITCVDLMIKDIDERFREICHATI